MGEEVSNSPHREFRKSKLALHLIAAQLAPRKEELLISRGGGKNFSCSFFIAGAFLLPPLHRFIARRARNEEWEGGKEIPQNAISARGGGGHAYPNLKDDKLSSPSSSSSLSRRSVNFPETFHRRKASLIVDRVRRLAARRRVSRGKS